MPAAWAACCSASMYSCLVTGLSTRECCKVGGGGALNAEGAVEAIEAEREGGGVTDVPAAIRTCWTAGAGGWELAITDGLDVEGAVEATVTALGEGVVVSTGGVEVSEEGVVTPVVTVEGVEEALACAFCIFSSFISFHLLVQGCNLVSFFLPRPRSLRDLVQS